MKQMIIEVVMAAVSDVINREKEQKKRKKIYVGSVARDLFESRGFTASVTLFAC